MNYIPAKEADFVDWPEKLISVSEAHAADWKLPPLNWAERRTIASRGEGGTNKKGPWSEVFQAIVPQLWY